MVQPRRRTPRVRRWQRAGGLAILVVLVATALSACVPPAKPIVSYYGDSIMVELGVPLRFQLGDDHEVRHQAFGGVALCDYTDTIIAEAERDHPKVVGLQFSGNRFTPCTRPDGREPTDEEYLEAYRQEATYVVDRLRAVGVTVVFIGSPPEPETSDAIVAFDSAAVDAVSREVAAASGGWATFLDAGAAVAAPDGSWTKQLPCLSFEGPAQGCSGGLIDVRGPDDHHFCPAPPLVPSGEFLACPVWSSGAWRYSARISSFVERAVVGAPMGTLDQASSTLSGLRFFGWAYDPQAGTDPIEVRVDIDGVQQTLLADRSRPDVAAVFPFAGAAHGFEATVQVAPGSHRVCAWALGVGPGGDASLGCHTVEPLTGPPVGNLDGAIPGAGTLTVAGWAIDPDTTAPIDVHVYVDQGSFAVRADVTRPDVGAAFPTWGSDHGFEAVVPAEPGPHRVCAYGIDSAGGTNGLLACRDVVVG